MTGEPVDPVPTEGDIMETTMIITAQDTDPTVKTPIESHWTEIGQTTLGTTLRGTAMAPVIEPITQ